jgi:leader peptidase (prepilin peptidase)/N-methyltransferase
VVELTTGGLFVLAALLATTVLEFFWLTAVLVILLLITVYDYYHFIIPDEMTLAVTGLMVGWLGFQYWQGALTLETLGWTAGASIAGAGFFFFLWFVSGGRWLGFGDVKLAIPLGLWVGPTAVFSFIVLSFWIGAAISLIILGWQKYERGKRRLHLSAETLTMKSAVPFAPFMIAGAVMVYVTQFNVLSLFSFT